MLQQPNSKTLIARRALLLGCISLLGFIVGSGPTTTHADTSQTLEVQGIRLSPFIFEHVVQKGESYSAELALANTTSAPIQLSVAIRDFIPAGRHGEVRFLPTNQTTDPHFSLSAWVEITKQPDFILNPGATTTATFRVNVPPEADDGTHYGGILFSFNDNAAGGGSKIVQSIGAILVIRTGNTQESGNVDSFTTPKKVYAEPRTPFSTIFTNTGNSHTSPKGKIEITNSLGSLVGLAYVNPNAQISLPHTTRAFDSLYQGRNMFGRYKANLTLYYGNPKLEIRKTVIFWVIPWKTILKTGGISVLIILLLYGLMVMYNKRLLKKAGLLK